MLLADSNILIYAAQQRHPELRDLIEREAPAISVVSVIESLGYHRLPPEEARFLKELFDQALILRLPARAVSLPALLPPQGRCLADHCDRSRPSPAGLLARAAVSGRVTTENTEGTEFQ